MTVYIVNWRYHMFDYNQKITIGCFTGMDYATAAIQAIQDAYGDKSNLDTSNDAFEFCSFEVNTVKAFANKSIPLMEITSQNKERSMEE